MPTRRLVWLRHLETERRVPVEVPTVFGRSDSYYRYGSDDERPDRLRDDVVEGLAALNYIKLCSDDQVSRVHGLIDPRIPGACDLNSTNGVFLNDKQLPTKDGEQGPIVSLVNKDRLQVGRAVFEVVLAEVSEEEARAQVHAKRHAFVGSDKDARERAVQVKDFLVDAKGFKVRDAVGWVAVIANFYHLQANADPEGMAVGALFCEIRGPNLVIGGESMPFAKLLPLFVTVPGRKILILEGAGDPSHCEEHFESEAFEDTVLITSPGAADPDSNLIVPTFQSKNVGKVVREGSPDDTLRGALDDAISGIDALVSEDTNILDVTWVSRFMGRIKVKFGKREHSDEFALSHSLRLGSSTFRF